MIPVLVARELYFSQLELVTSIGMSLEEGKAQPVKCEYLFVNTTFFFRGLHRPSYLLNCNLTS